MKKVVNKTTVKFIAKVIAALFIYEKGMPIVNRQLAKFKGAGNA